MSRKNQPKDKRLDNLIVLPSQAVYDQVGTKPNGKPDNRIKKGIKIYGKVKKGTTVYVSTNNRKGENHKYVDDFSVLNKKTKKEICDMLENQNKRVVYLVEKSSLPKNFVKPKPIKKPAKSTGLKNMTTKKGAKKK